VAAFDAYLVRGWIRLADGDVLAASVDAARVLDLGRSFGGSQLLYPALAFAARARNAAGATNEAHALATELLEAWAETTETTLPSFWVAELALVLRALGRSTELETASGTRAPRTRWLEAALAVASADDEQARRIYREIGLSAGDALFTTGRSRLADRAPRP
jgi:hypothetical protein